MKIDQPGIKPDYDLKQHQPVRSSPDSQNIRNASSVLQNPHAESNAPKASGLPQPKPAVAKRSPTEEQKQNGTNGKAHVSRWIEFILRLLNLGVKFKFKLRLSFKLLKKF